MKYASRDGTWFGNVAVEKHDYGSTGKSETEHKFAIWFVPEVNRKEQRYYFMDELLFNTREERNREFEDLKQKFMGEG